MWLLRRVQVGRTVEVLKLLLALLHLHREVLRFALVTYLQVHPAILSLLLARAVLRTGAILSCLRVHRLLPTAKVELCDCQLVLEVVVVALQFQQGRHLLHRVARRPC